MICNTCEYKNINHIKLYNNIVDECSNCEFCSIPLKNYMSFIKDAIISNHFLNINVFTIIDTLSVKNQNKYEYLYNDFLIELDKLKITNYKCRICGEFLYELRKNNTFSFYICDNCMNIFFNKKEFKKYIKSRINFINKYYFLIMLKKRFLHLI